MRLRPPFIFIPGEAGPAPAAEAAAAAAGPPRPVPARPRSRGMGGAKRGPGGVVGRLWAGLRRESWTRMGRSWGEGRGEAGRGGRAGQGWGGAGQGAGLEPGAIGCGRGREESEKEPGRSPPGGLFGGRGRGWREDSARNPGDRPWGPRRCWAGPLARPSLPDF